MQNHIKFSALLHTPKDDDGRENRGEENRRFKILREMTSFRKQQRKGAACSSQVGSAAIHGNCYEASSKRRSAILRFFTTRGLRGRARSQITRRDTMTLYIYARIREKKNKYNKRERLHSTCWPGEDIIPKTTTAATATQHVCVYTG